MHAQFKAELGRLLIVVVLSLVLGSLTDQFILCLFIIPLFLFAWHLHQVFCFEIWMHTGNRARFKKLRGIWRYAADSVARARWRREKNQQSLSKTINLFQQTFAALPDAAIVLDNRLRIRWHNLAADQLFGLNDVKGKTIKDFVQQQDFHQYLDQADYAEPLSFNLLDNSGIARQLEITMAQVGRSRLLLTVHDVSAHHRLESVRRDFIANVSHELRTPLTVINGYLEILHDDAQDDISREAIQASERQTQHMLNIVSDLLTLSRLQMQTEQSLAEATAVDMAMLIEELAEDARRLSGAAEHSITTLTDKQLWLLADSKEMAGVIGNLIFNAVLHTPPGTAVDIYWGPDGDNAKLTVADKGQGIDAKHLDRLTERFYRVDKGRSRDKGGTGLGLSIVKYIVNRHQGELEIDSSPGRGSRFICRFPKQRLRFK